MQCRVAKSSVKFTDDMEKASLTSMALAGYDFLIKGMKLHIWCSRCDEYDVLHLEHCHLFIVVRITTCMLVVSANVMCITHEVN